MLLLPTHAVTPHLTNHEALVLGAWTGRAGGPPPTAEVVKIGQGVVAVASTRARCTAAVSTFVRVVGGSFGGGLFQAAQLVPLPPIPVLLVCAIVLLQKSYEVGYFRHGRRLGRVVDPITSIITGVLLLGEAMPTGWLDVIPALFRRGPADLGDRHPRARRPRPRGTHFAPAPRGRSPQVIGIAGPGRCPCGLTGPSPRS